MIAPEEAEQAIGAEVVYHGQHDEHGTIAGVSGDYVMVRYGAEKVSKATPPPNLDWAHQLGSHSKAHRESPPGRCGNGNCSRRHDYLITCSCGRRFWTGKLKFTRRRALDHQRGREES